MMLPARAKLHLFLAYKLSRRNPTQIHPEWGKQDVFYVNMMCSMRTDLGKATGPIRVITATI